MWRRIRKIEEGNSQNMKEIIDRTKNTAEKMVKDRSSYIVVAAVMVCFVIVLAAWIMGKKHIDSQDYITVTYNGINGYASAECSVDSEKLYKTLAGKEVNMEKLTGSLLIHLRHILKKVIFQTETSLQYMLNMIHRLRLIQASGLQAAVII